MSDLSGSQRNYERLLDLGRQALKRFHTASTDRYFRCGSLLGCCSFACGAEHRSRPCPCLGLIQRCSRLQNTLTASADDLLNTDILFNTMSSPMPLAYLWIPLFPYFQKCNRRCTPLPSKVGLQTVGRSVSYASPVPFRCTETCGTRSPLGALPRILQSH